MTGRTITIRGEAYLTLETVAECYRVEITWLEEVYALGLLGRGERVEGTTAIAAAMLDRMSRIVRWNRQLGVDLSGILALLEDVE